MGGFEFNKLSASVLVALIILALGDFASQYFIASNRNIQKNSFHIPVQTTNAMSANHEEKIGPIEPLLEQASAEKGELVFKKCQQCHSIKSDEHAIGPSLLAVVGKKIASAATYAYSSAFKEKSNDIWTVENINAFIHNPRKFISGTKMSFMGLEDINDRANVIKYLQSLKD